MDNWVSVDVDCILQLSNRSWIIFEFNVKVTVYEKWLSENVYWLQHVMLYYFLSNVLTILCKKHYGLR